MSETCLSPARLKYNEACRILSLVNKLPQKSREVPVRIVHIFERTARWPGFILFI